MNNFDLMNIAFLPLERRRDFPRTAVSSAIPSSEVAGTGRHSIRETAPEDLGGFPPADCGPATVGVLYPVTCEPRFYDAASRILEDEGPLAGNPHDNCNELGALIQQWISDARENWEPR
jgi:hypothetical protein